jgi:MFS family permease
MTPLQRARLSTAVCFFVFGALLSTWVSRIPVVQHELQLNNAELGIALIGAPVGQVLAMGLTPRFVHRFSSATTSRWAAVATGGCVVLLGLAGNLVVLTVFLVLFGFALGTLDICMNTQGVAVERGYARPIMSGLHGVSASAYWSAPRSGRARPVSASNPSPTSPRRAAYSASWPWSVPAICSAPAPMLSPTPRPTGQ